MKIEDLRTDCRYVDVRHPSIKIGDVVQTIRGEICLVVWSNVIGKLCNANPGHNGLVDLRSGMAWTDANSFPKVRKINATLTIDEDN